MAELVWDETGEKVFQFGIARGVLYLADGRAVVWNGLTGMDESSDAELTSYYMDGVKFLQNLSPGDFSGKLKAWTYPDEFDEVLGIAEVEQGLRYYEQPPKSFSLSYQTRIGNDLDQDAGYKIHLLYNLLAVPDDVSYATLSSNAVDPTEFSWSMTGTPQIATGFRPTVHVVVDSTKTDPQVLQTLEDTLYGTSVSDPNFPSIDIIRELFKSFGALVIVDNGDGTWTAIDIGDTYISMTSATEFEIDSPSATMLDAYSYTISTFP